MYLKTLKGLFLVALLGLSVSAHGAMVRVVSKVADKTGEWAEAFTDIQTAILAAGANGTVFLRDGVYAVDATLALTAAGQTLCGESRDGTILDGGGRVRILSSAGFATPGILHLTFRNGKDEECGGAVLFSEGAGAFRIEDCVFLDNTASQRGGAIYSYNNENGLTTNCLFFGNSVTATVKEMGGGAYCADKKSTLLTDCVFSNNVAAGTAPLGGAVYFPSAGSIERCLFVTNAADATSGSSRGGNVYLASSGRISDCVFSGYCKATYGMAISASSQVLIDRCSIADLRPAGSFGVIHVWKNVTIDGCTFSGISQGDYVMLESTSGIVIRNCLVTGNSGGALVRGHNSQLTRIEHCTFAGNVSGVKVANNTSNFSTNVFVNCILIGSTPLCSGAHCAVISNSVVSTASSGPMDDGVIVTGHPGFFSSVRGDYRLRAGSPCLDAGLDLGWQASGKDLSGDARWVGAAPDLGCYERQIDEQDPVHVRAVSTAADKTGDWKDAHVGIQPAVDAALSDDIVMAKDGTYCLEVPVTVLNKSLTLKGECRNGTVLNGQGACRCLDVKVQSGQASLLEFANLTLTNGFAGTSTDYANHYGSGGAAWLSCDSATGRITLKNCRVTHSRTILTTGANLDFACGGGVFANHRCVLEDCLIDNNCASNACGGGVRIVGVGDDISNAGALIVGCVISNNVSRGSGGAGGSGAHGGGIYAKDAAVQIEQTIFVSNEALADASTGYGGALLLNGIQASISNCQFIANRSTSFGAAIDLNQAASAVRVRNCRFVRNSGGYGTLNNGNADNIFDACSFTSNENASCFTTGNTPVFRNCLFAGNKTSAAIVINNGTGSLYAENCTITANKTGIEVQNGSPVVALVNCIVSENVRDFDRKDAVTGDITFALTNCLVQACPASAYVAEDCIVGKSPRFVSAATGDYTLKSGSPCRERATELSWMTGATDLDGAPRIIGWYGQTRDEDPSAMPDIGCYECSLKRQGLMLLVR